MSSTDFTLIEKLRKENLDQFLTLVRMHLSFVVDINTDDVDGSTDKPKQFRWNFHKKKNSSNSQNNNGKTTAEANSITEEGMARVYELIDFLSKEDSVTQEGIFRRTGSLSRQQELRLLLLSGTDLGLEESRFSVHDCASVLKGFLAELPQPLLMDQYYQTYCTLAMQYPPNVESSETKLLTALQLLLLLLTPQHRLFLQRLLKLLKVAADNETSNRMSPDTLATMFTPHLLCPRKLSPEIFHADSLALAPVISFMIKKSEQLFEAPNQLATDIAAYFTMRERKRMMSPDIDLDESISDRTAANTVYTFVDRHRTSAENESNPTDTALAQLYAHIQALPDSQHKRRLIKQFNRQNGYGTPIQVRRTGKVAGSRSFGDSIKRHIFNKGLLNKTPKKMGSGSIIHTVDERATPRKEKPKLTNEDKITAVEVSHKSVVLKNLANTMAGAGRDEDSESDASGDGAGPARRARRRGPKFASEPNLSLLVPNDETPKNAQKKNARLFRSKILSASQSLNKKYRTRPAPPTCARLDRTGSGTDDSAAPAGGSPGPDRGGSGDERDAELRYLTSTPGVPDGAFGESRSTPYTMNFRRASMSPITKSTQKLSKAMQESIMTPRSRKPLIVTSERRDGAPEPEKSTDTVYGSMSPRNDSDFVSSDDENASRSKSSPRSCGRHGSGSSLTEPFREYLLGRSVLTATPVDLSLNNPDVGEEITESLMFCLDGNVPSDLASSIGNLAVDRNDSLPKRSPLRSLNGVNVDSSVLSPSRKRSGSLKRDRSVDSKKLIVEKENVSNDANGDYELRETDL